MPSLATADFLAEMFGDRVGEGHEIVLFSDKRSTWCRTIGDALKAIQRLNESNDTYYHVALHDRATAIAEARERAAREQRQEPKSVSATRGCSESARALPGVWADIDIAGVGHEKHGLAPTREAALDALAKMPLVATTVLWTGGGLHAYWRFRELEDVATREARAIAANRGRGWQQLYTAISGFSIDATHDLARVLRLPGLRSHKRDVIVDAIVRNNVAYNPSDFDEYAASGPEPCVIAAGSFTLREVAFPPREKLRALLDLDARFTATWMRKRRDLPSQSEYDLSLASMASRAGWSDQEIVDLLIAHRAMHGQEPKLRTDYYQLTLGRARSDSAADRAVAALNDAVSQPAQAAQAGPVRASSHSPKANSQTRAASAPTAIQAASGNSAFDRATALTNVSTVVGARVERVLKYRGDPPSFAIEIDGIHVTLGSVDVILRPRQFRSVIAATSGHVMRSMKDSAWQPVAQMLLRLAEEQDLGPDSKPSDLVRDWLAGYLSAYPVETREEYRDATITARNPVEISGAVVIFLEPFSQWVVAHGHPSRQQTMRSWLAKHLRVLGATTTVLAYLRRHGDGERHDMMRTTAFGWVLPAGLVSTREKRPARAERAL